MKIMNAKNWCTTAAALALGLAAAQTGAQSAAGKPPPPAVPVAPGQMITPQQYLAEKPGITSWRVLGLVQPIKEQGKIVPEYDKQISALNGKTVKVQGFMLPLDMGDKQKRFLLSAAPPHCTFCLPGGAETMIEVRAKNAVRFGFDAVTLSGKLAVLKDDPAGLYYRLTDAEEELERK
jgi:uncharacterized protein